MERHCACCHFVEHSTERKQIRSRVQFFGSDLLRRHVRNRPHGRSRTRQVLDIRFHRRQGCTSCCSSRTPPLSRHFGQSEIQNLGVSSFSNKDICWLDVPVHNASRMSRIQCVGDLDPQ